MYEIVDFIVKYPLVSSVISVLIVILLGLLSVCEFLPVGAKEKYISFIRYVFKKYKIKDSFFEVYKEYKTKEMSVEQQKKDIIAIRNSYDELF